MASPLVTLSTRLSASKRWTAELTVGLWLIAPTTGLEPTRVDLERFETLRLSHSATPARVMKLVYMYSMMAAFLVTEILHWFTASENLMKQQNKSNKMIKTGSMKNFIAEESLADVSGIS